MFNFFKNKETLLRLKIKKLLTLERKFANAKIKSVAIITTDKFAKKQNLQEVVERALNLANSKIFTFKKFDKNVELSPLNFTNKSFNKKGEVKEENFKTFLETKFDLLICLFDENNLYLEYTAAFSKANYKVGFANVNADLFDLEIHSNCNNISEFFSELKRYLQILGKL